MLSIIGKIFLISGIAFQTYWAFVIHKMKSKSIEYERQMRELPDNEKSELIKNPFENEEDIKKLMFFSIKSILILNFCSLAFIIIGILITAFSQE